MTPLIACETFKMMKMGDIWKYNPAKHHVWGYIWTSLSIYLLFMDSIGQWDYSILSSFSIFASPKEEHAVFKGDEIKIILSPRF